jgi:hypothetical protein
VTAQPKPLNDSATDDLLIETYARLAKSESALRNRRAIARRFTRTYGGIDEWSRVPVDVEVVPVVVEV